MFADRRHTPGHTPYGNLGVVACVAILLFASAPLAIGFLIAAIIVNAVNRQSRGALTHIIEKARVAVPSLANGNSPTSVILKFFAFRIGTPLSHAHPNVVSFGFLSDSCKAVLLLLFGNQFIVKASARPGVSADKTTIKNQLGFTALTQAKAASYSPSAWVDVIGRIRNYFKSCEGSSDEGYFLRHGVVLFNAVFSGGMAAVTASRCAILPQTHERIN